MTIQKVSLGHLLKEQKMTGKVKISYSSYANGDLRADTIKVGNDWGCDFYKSGEFIKSELYKGHSESYAESAADNYVFGIKKI